MNLLQQAIRQPDLDEAIAPIQTALEIETGDCAGQVLDHGVWRLASRHDRARLLAQWLAAEAIAADAEVPEADRRKFWTVAIYHVDRVYGGPEEGGWYYTAGSRVDSVEEHGEAGVPRVFWDEQQARDFASRLRERLNFGVNAGRREISSVLSTGRYAPEVYEGFPPEHFPETRPHYE